FCSSRRRHTRFSRDWSSDVCSSDLTYRRAEIPAVTVQIMSASGQIGQPARPGRLRLRQCTLSHAAAAAAKPPRCGRSPVPVPAVPGFLRFTADIDLHQNVQIRHGIRALLAEATGNFVAVDGFHPVKMPGHQARFIGLQRADKMPFNIAQMRQRSNFFQTVLYIILTKSALAQPVDGLYLSGGFGFTDRQQAYTGGVALMVAAGLLQSLLHSLIVLFSAWHG